MTPPIPDPAAADRTALAALQGYTRGRVVGGMRIIDADPDEAMAVAYGYLSDAAGGQVVYSPLQLQAIARGVEEGRAEYTATLSIGRASTARVRELQRAHGKETHG